MCNNSAIPRSHVAFPKPSEDLAAAFYHTAKPHPPTQYLQPRISCPNGHSPQQERMQGSSAGDACRFIYELTKSIASSSPVLFLRTASIVLSCRRTSASIQTSSPPSASSSAQISVPGGIVSARRRFMETLGWLVIPRAGTWGGIASTLEMLKKLCRTTPASQEPIKRGAQPKHSRPFLIGQVTCGEESIYCGLTQRAWS